MLDIPGFEGRGVLLAVWVIVVVQLSDVMQFIWGKLSADARLRRACRRQRRGRGSRAGR